MQKSKKQLLTLTALSCSILLCAGMTGCSSRNTATTNKTETSSTDSPAKNHANVVADETHNDEISADTTTSSGYYLSLGVLDEAVVPNTASRNRSDVTISHKKVLFPQGSMRSIAIKNWARKESAYNPSKAEIIQYIDALENAEIVKAIPENASEKMTKIETHMIYLNKQGKFRTISVTSFGNGYHELSVEKDDTENFAKSLAIKADTDKKYKQIFLRSKDAEKKIKSWIHWEDQDDKGFDAIQNAYLSVDGSLDNIKLTDNQLQLLQKHLRSGKRTSESPCGSEYYFTCTQEDGKTFHFSISADGESVSTDKNVYTIDHPNNVKIAKLLKDI